MNIIIRERYQWKLIGNDLDTWLNWNKILFHLYSLFEQIYFRKLNAYGKIATMCTISCLKNEFTNGDNASSATSSMHHNNGSPINTESIQEREIPI